MAVDDIVTHLRTAMHIDDLDLLLVLPERWGARSWRGRTARLLSRRRSSIALAEML